MANLLYAWAKIHKLGRLEKRQLFNELIAEKLNIQCEARIYRVLTRLTFQTLRKQHEISFEFTSDEINFSKILKELDLSPSTCLHWYYSTFKEKPIKIIPNACKDNLDGTICECCIDEKIREKLKKNYEYKLASKRIYQIIIKIELFKNALAKEKIILDDDEIRKSLRRIASHKYRLERLQREAKDPKKRDIIVKKSLERYRGRTRKEHDSQIEKVLEKRKIGPVAVLKWFYLIKNHPELIKKAQNKEIEPDEVFIQSMNSLKQDLIQGGEL